MGKALKSGRIKQNNEVSTQNSW